jgi:hypothetical protein
MERIKYSHPDDRIVWVCQYCGIHNELWIDLTIEGKQDFVEDCRICCRPNRIIVQKDEDEQPMVEARPSDE